MPVPRTALSPFLAMPAVLAVLAIVASGCTPSETADPDPEIRALCEARCFSERGTCRGSAYDCDRAAKACRRTCAEGL